MPRQDRVTRLINFAGALQRLREAELYARQLSIARSPRATEREIEALKQNLNDMRAALTASDRNRLGTASFEALASAKRIVKGWDHGEPELIAIKETHGGAVTVNTDNPVMVAAREAMAPDNYVRGTGVLIEGTDTRLRAVSPLPNTDDLASMVRQLTEKISASTLPSGMIAFNAYCSWVSQEEPIQVTTIAESTPPKPPHKIIKLTREEWGARSD